MSGPSTGTPMLTDDDLDVIRLALAPSYDDDELSDNVKFIRKWSQFIIEHATSQDHRDKVVEEHHNYDRDMEESQLNVDYDFEYRKLQNQK